MNSLRREIQEKKRDEDDPARTLDPAVPTRCAGDVALRRENGCKREKISDARQQPRARGSRRSQHVLRLRPGPATLRPDPSTGLIELINEALGAIEGGSGRSLKADGGRGA